MLADPCLICSQQKAHFRPSIKAGLSPTMPASELSRGTTLEPAAPTPRCSPAPNIDSPYKVWRCHAFGQLALLDVYHVNAVV